MWDKMKPATLMRCRLHGIVLLRNLSLPVKEDYMKLRKGRIVWLTLAAIVVWLAGNFLIYQVLLSNYTYSMERVNPVTGAAERIYQPGEREARARFGIATLVLTCAVVAALAVTIGIGVRPGRWLRGGASTGRTVGAAATEDTPRSPSQEARR